MSLGFKRLRAEEACNLKMEATVSSEKSVPMYQRTRRYELEDRSLNADHWRVQNLIIKSVVWFLACLLCDEGSRYAFEFSVFLCPTVPQSCMYVLYVNRGYLPTAFIISCGRE